MAGGASEAGVPDFIRGSELLSRAQELSARAHADQRRRAGDPYIDHLVGVARCLHDAGFREQVVAAALLHDVLEDADIAAEDLVGSFGVEVGELVLALTEDSSIEDWSERKRALREQVAAAGTDAAAIYAVDKLSNVGDLRRLAARIGDAAADTYAVSLEERLRAWWEDLEMVGREVPELEQVEAFRAELDAVQSELARTPAPSE